ncbi:MAG: hypothetical protein KAT07_13835, partial [Calditrichia bacterium]|nr:hypothetical protein [Calditrichia bacterium]
FIKFSQLYSIYGPIEEYNIDWIHPSCGDMVSKELSGNPKDRIHFLKHCNVLGLKHAVSVGGGSKGSEVLPILKSREDWKIFKKRCTENLDITLASNMFDSIQQLAKDDKYSKKQQLLEDVLKEVIIKAVDDFNNKGWTSRWLIAVFKINEQLKLALGNIQYEDEWFEGADSVMTSLGDECTEWNDDSDIDDFIKLTKAITVHTPAFFDKKEVEWKLENVLDTFQQRGEEESAESIDYIPPDEAEELCDSYDELRDLFEDISDFTLNEKLRGKLIKISKDFDFLMEEVTEYLPSEPDYHNEDDLLDSHSEECGINQIFEDL